MSADVANTGVADGELLQFVERVERLEEEIAGLNGDKSDLYKEMKGRGFDVKIVREIVRLRKQDHADRQEHDAILELYLEAIDRAARSQASAPARARAHGEPPHDPETGEITDASDDDGARDSVGSRGHVGPGPLESSAAPDDAQGTGEGGPSHAGPPAEDHPGAGEAACETVQAEAAPVPIGPAEPLVSGDEASPPARAESQGSASRRVLTAPAADGPAILRFAPKPGDMFLNPHHTVTPLLRGNLCESLGLADTEFDAFRAEMIAGRSADAALSAVRAG